MVKYFEKQRVKSKLLDLNQWYLFVLFDISILNNWFKTTESQIVGPVRWKMSHVNNILQILGSKPKSKESRIKSLRCQESLLLSSRVKSKSNNILKSQQMKKKTEKIRTKFLGYQEFVSLNYRLMSKLLGVKL